MEIYAFNTHILRASCPAKIFLQKNAKLRLTFCAAIAIIALAVRRCATENVERWLSWSKAHDWKSCRAPKALKGSNPFLSATTPSEFSEGVCFFRILRAVPVQPLVPVKKQRRNPDGSSAAQTVEKVKIRHHRRTCAADGDTYREILREIVCEERSHECAISRKILSRGIPKGGTGRSGEAVPDGSPFCSVSGFPTRCKRHPRGGMALCYGFLVTAAAFWRRPCAGSARSG